MKKNSQKYLITKNSIILISIFIFSNLFSYFLYKNIFIHDFKKMNKNHFYLIKEIKDSNINKKTIIERIEEDFYLFKNEKLINENTLLFFQKPYFQDLSFTDKTTNAYSPKLDLLTINTNEIQKETIFSIDDLNFYNFKQNLASLDFVDNKYIDLAFYHEIGHAIYNNKYNHLKISNNLKNKIDFLNTNFISLMQQESFCDIFSIVYFIQKNNLSLEQANKLILSLLSSRYYNNTDDYLLYNENQPNYLPFQEHRTELSLIYLLNVINFDSRNYDFLKKINLNEIVEISLIFSFNHLFIENILKQIILNSNDTEYINNVKTEFNTSLMNKLIYNNTQDNFNKIIYNIRRLSLNDIHKYEKETIIQKNLNLVIKNIEKLKYK